MDMDDRLTELLERDGRRYVIGVCVAPCVASLLLSGPGIAAVVCLYLGLSMAEYLRILALVVALGGLMLLWAFVTNRHAVALLLGWVERRELEGKARAAAFALPSRLFWAALRVGLIVVAPILALALARTSGYTSALDVVGLMVGAASSIIIAAAGAFYLVDVLLQPVRASFGPAATGPQRSSSLARRLLVATTLGIVYGAASVGLVATDRAEAGPGYLLAIYAGGFGVAALSAVLIGPTLATVLRPIRDLRRGAVAIGEGRLDVKIPVVSQDELGELAATFNEMVDELRSSRGRIVAAGDAERRRMERDLHDGAQQHFVLLRLKLALARQLLDVDRAQAEAALTDAVEDLDRALAELRELAHGIYPVALSEGGLTSALRAAVDRAGLPASLDCYGVGRHPAEVEAAVYFCCVEALQNAAKHAGAGARASVRLTQDASDLRFEVADSGTGRGGPPGVGQQNMADRMSALGGRLEIETVPGAGTTVRGSVAVRGD
jgi:signal transduction histidine kinase